MKVRLPEEVEKKIVDEILNEKSYSKIQLEYNVCKSKIHRIKMKYQERGIDFGKLSFHRESAHRINLLEENNQLLKIINTSVIEIMKILRANGESIKG